MARNTKTQWDFGELFPVEATRQVLTVSDLTARVKRLLERDVGAVWVGGEISNLRLQSSGHAYFTLKDAGSQVGCVLFRGTAASEREALADGAKVILQGDITVYEPRGQYQLVVRRVELQGVGALQLAFERLKRRLEAEGLFAPGRKRPLPPCPTRIGLVSSPSGAAIRDVLQAVRRRNPALEVVFVPCRVQGDGAAGEVASAVALLNEWHNAAAPAGLDAILVTRGGGSIEDLWAFNEEIVARALAASVVPVVSAIGHEIDFTIADFVADVRAATPTAGAELLTEGVFGSRDFVTGVRTRLAALARGALESRGQEAARLGLRLARAHPRRRIEDFLQRLDELHSGLLRDVRQHWREKAVRGEGLWRRLQAMRPTRALVFRAQRVAELRRRLGEHRASQMEQLRSQVTGLAARLRLLSPLNVLERGYSITTDAATGQVIHSAAGIRPGKRLRTRLRDGTMTSRVESEG